MRQYTFRISDSTVPGAFKSRDGLFYLPVGVEKIEGSFFVCVGSLKSKKFFSESMAENEYDRISRLSAISKADLQEYT